MLNTAAMAHGDSIRQHRGDHSRLGLAIQMVYLRHPSRVLPQSEAPYPPLLGIVAAQLKVTPAAWSQYAKRDGTRREHLQELLDLFELRQFDRSYYRQMIDWLMPPRRILFQGPSRTGQRPTQIAVRCALGRGHSR